MKQALLLLAGVLAGCSAPSARSVSADSVDTPTIVSLNPCSDAVLTEIASPAQVLALSHYSRDPSASSIDVRRALQFGVTGGTVEEVLALDPDVVVAGSFMPPATRAALQRFGVRVETFGIAASVEDSVAQVRRLGAITGKEGAAETLAAAIADAARPVHDPQPVSTVLWQPGGIVAGEAALVTDMMHRAGLSSHSAARGLSQADYLSLERLLADAPDLLLVAGQERAQHHAALEAVPDMRVEGFDPALLYCGGPTIIRAMERLREIRAMSLRGDTRL